MLDILRAAAVTLKAAGGSGDDLTNLPRANADTVFAHALDLVYYLTGATAVIVIVVAGILYATAAGNSERIKRAKNAILYSVVGLAIVMLAFAITAFIRGNVQ